MTEVWPKRPSTGKVVVRFVALAASLGVLIVAIAIILTAGSASSQNLARECLVSAREGYSSLVEQLPESEQQTWKDRWNALADQSRDASRFFDPIGPEGPQDTGEALCVRVDRLHERLGSHVDERLSS